MKNLPAMQETWVRSLGWEDPGVGDGNLLQYTCLENPMDSRAWRATVHGGRDLARTHVQKNQPLPDAPIPPCLTSPTCGCSLMARRHPISGSAGSLQVHPQSGLLGNSAQLHARPVSILRRCVYFPCPARYTLQRPFCPSSSSLGKEPMKSFPVRESEMEASRPCQPWGNFTVYIRQA